MDIKRRNFLKTLGITGAGVFVINPVLGAFGKSADKSSAASGEEKGKSPAGKSKGANSGNKDIGVWYPSTCQGCTTWCPIEILVQSGRAVKVRGNQNSQCNPGQVCPRGHLVIQETYDADRLKTPMKRTNASKGKGIDPQFVPITWAAAMTEIAAKIISVRNTTGGKTIGYFRGRYAHKTDIQYSAMTKILGTPNKWSHSVLCAEAEKMGPLFTENKAYYRDYDLDNCRHLLIWGTDPTRANRMIPTIIKKIETVSRNGKITVVDPCYSTSAAKANKWMPIIPGTDGALASAIAHVILTQGLWHVPFVGNHTGTNPFIAGVNTVPESAFTEVYTYGLVKWWNAELNDKTPAWAAPICGISAADIIQLAEDMGAVAPNVSVYMGPGVAMQPRGAYAAMGVYALNGLLGSWENIGGPVRPPSASPAVPAYPSVSSTYMDTIAVTGYASGKIDTTGTEFYPGITDAGLGKAALTNTVPDTIISGLPYALEMVIGNYCNFVHSGTGAERWEAAMAIIPYFVHISTHASEMSMFADIVLPAANGTTERSNFLSTSQNMRTEVSIIQQCATRLFDVRGDEDEITYMLAQELNVQGFTKLLDYLNANYKDPDTTAAPTTYQEFAEYSTKLFTKASYDTLGGWDAYKQQGVKTTQPNAYQAHWGATGNSGGTGGKFEFYSSLLKKNLNAHAVDSYQKVMTVTLTGTSGTANINITPNTLYGAVAADYLATFNTSLTVTASDFVATHTAALLLLGIKVKASAATIVFTGVDYGKTFTVVAPANVSTDLAGTVATTQAIGLLRWNKTVDQLMIDINYPGCVGEKAFVPHYEAPPTAVSTSFPLLFIDRKSRFNREGRSQNLPNYYQFKRLDPGDEDWSDVLLMNPVDATTLNIVNGQTVTITTVINTVGITCKAKLWEGVRPGTVAKTYGQGHWAYGRFATKNLSTATALTEGGSNNLVIPSDTERISGGMARYGGFFAVKVQ